MLKCTIELEKTFGYTYVTVIEEGSDRDTRPSLSAFKRTGKQSMQELVDLAINSSIEYWNGRFNTSYTRDDITFTN